jgi:hypothetical protein
MSGVAADDVLIEGRDYVLLPDGRLVFTAAYLLRRGKCCESGCRSCPYETKSDTPEREATSEADS